MDHRRKQLAQALAARRRRLLPTQTQTQTQTQQIQSQTQPQQIQSQTQTQPQQQGQGQKEEGKEGQKEEGEGGSIRISDAMVRASLLKSVCDRLQQHLPSARKPKPQILHTGASAGPAFLAWQEFLKSRQRQYNQRSLLAAMMRPTATSGGAGSDSIYCDTELRK